VCHKVLLIEKADEVVEVHSSLMAGVAREVLGRKNLKAGEDFYLSRHQLKHFIEVTQFVCNLENDLYILLEYAYSQKLRQTSLSSPTSRFFCIGRSGSRNANISGRVVPDIE
jgi:hypothetical protein